ncbi:JmjC domain-containing protein [Rheinheimera sp.]|uniref:JmjC domain-containing protein n=1 Tax=Rheinheimera sp. TaxID=1869214 RepID=UPI003D2B39C2
MILAQARHLLAQVLHPLSYEQFFQEVVSRRPLLLAADAALPARQLLGPDPKALLLSQFAEYATSLTCHIRQAQVPAPKPRAVPDAAAFAGLLAEYHSNDYTVRFPDVTNATPELAAFNRALTLLFGNPASTVLFWSLTGAEAPVHDDEVDVIAIQLVGTKRWFISDEPPKLPNKWKALGASVPPLGTHRIYDVKPGDLLYLPRGTTHTVQSTGESLHISIGFVPVTIREAIGSALDYMADFEKPLRANAAGRADALAHGQELDLAGAQMRAGLERLLQLCQQPGFIEAALAHRQARMLLELPKLTKPAAEMPPLNRETRVQQTPLAIGQVNVLPHILDFRFPGDQLLVHPAVAPSMEFVRQTPQFAVKDIPGPIGDDVRLVLVEKLLHSGFLQLV